VLAAVGLDGNSVFRTCEIENEAPNGMLSTEPEAGEPAVS
jgi:hypothetical protein